MAVFVGSPVVLEDTRVVTGMLLLGAKHLSRGILIIAEDVGSPLVASSKVYLTILIVTILWRPSMYRESVRTVKNTRASLREELHHNDDSVHLDYNVFSKDS